MDKDPPCGSAPTSRVDGESWKHRTRLTETRVQQEMEQLLEKKCRPAFGPREPCSGERKSLGDFLIEMTFPVSKVDAAPHEEFRESSRGHGTRSHGGMVDKSPPPSSRHGSDRSSVQSRGAASDLLETDRFLAGFAAQGVADGASGFAIAGQIKPEQPGALRSFDCQLGSGDCNQWFPSS